MSILFRESTEETKDEVHKIAKILTGPFANRDLYIVNKSKLNDQDKTEGYVTSTYYKSKQEDSSSRFTKARFIVEDLKKGERYQTKHFQFDSLVPIFNWEITRQSWWISGRAGCGKSVFTNMIMKSYREKYPDGLIMVFSEKDSDPSFTTDGLSYVELDESLENLNYMDIPENTLCVFDDYDAISNKKLKKSIYNLLNNILALARQRRIHCAASSHVSSNGIETKMIVSNVLNVVVYPGFSSHDKIRSLLRNWFSFSKAAADKICQNDVDRWVLIERSYNKVLAISESEIYIVQNN